MTGDSNKHTASTQSSSRTIAVCGMLLAVLLLLAFLPFLNFYIGPFRVTLLHIPVLIGLMVEGLPVGLGLGAAFGIISLVRAALMPTATSFIFMNPIIAIIPRLMIPVTALFITRAVRRITRRDLIAEAAGAFCGAAASTILVFAFILLIYAERYGLVMRDLGRVDALPIILLGSAFTNGLPEAVIAAVLVPAITRALRRAGLTPKGIA